MASVRSLFVMVSGMLLGLLLAAGSSQANEVEFDRYVVHYTVVNTTFLSPEVASAYNLRRSSNRALVNVVIMKREGNGIETVPGNVSGQAVNLNRQVRRLSFREVRDGDAFYHLAEVPVRPGEVLDFDLRVTAQDSDEVMPVRFRQTFYPH
jgi:hypothetical protein